MTNMAGAEGTAEETGAEKGAEETGAGGHEEHALETKGAGTRACRRLS